MKLPKIEKANLFGMISTIAYVKCGGYFVSGLILEMPFVSLVGIGFGILGVLSFGEFLNAKDEKLREENDRL